MSDGESNKFLAKVQTYWPVVAGVCVAIAWVTSSLISATFSMASVKAEVSNNIEDIRDNEDSIKARAKVDGKISKRLTVLETEVTHIRTHQSENHKDIKKQLDTMQQDLKDLSK